MAERTVTVRLRASIEDYARKMGEAAAATVAVGKAGEAASSKLVGSGKKAQEVGRDLTKYVSLPLAAAGVAAVKMSVDFDTAFAHMEGLAGVTAGEIDGLKQSVLDLAHATGRGPQDLAEGLYFIRSAGIAGKTAVDALTVSARAAAAGLGDTQTVADAVTSAINAYGAENLSAARAGDVLAATVRDGKAEASALAPQFGRLLPVASELGITFDQVGAGMAFLSRASGDADLSATQLNGVMRSLLKPSQQAGDALATIGLTAQDVRDAIKEKGLLKTLEDLRAKLGDNGFREFFQDSRALNGALALTGHSAKEAEQVFADLKSSAGSLDTAFDAVAKTTGFKLNQAWADIQVAAIKVGDVVGPIVANLASSVAGLATAFADLPKPAQDALLIFGGYAAVLGPLLSIAGKVAEGLGKLHQRLIDGAAAGKTFGEALGRGGLAYNVGVAGAAFATGLVALDLWNRSIAEGKKQNDDFIAALDRGEFGAPKFDKATASLSEYESRIAGLQRGIDQALAQKTGASGLGGALLPGGIDEDANRQLDDLAKKLGASKAELEGTRNKALDLAKAMGIGADAALALVINHSDLVNTAADGTTTFDEEAVAIAQVTDALKRQSDQIKGQMDPLFAITDAMQANEAAQRKVAEAQRAATTGVAQRHAELQQRVADATETLADAQDRLAKATTAEEKTAASRAVRDATRQLTQANQDLADSAGDAEKAQRDVEAANYDAVKSAEAVQVALLALAQNVSNGTVSIDTARQNLQAWVDQGLITQDQANNTAAKFQVPIDKASELSTTVSTLNQNGLTLNVNAPGLDEAVAGAEKLRDLAAVSVGILTGQIKVGPDGTVQATPAATPDATQQSYTQGLFGPTGTIGKHALGGRLSPGWNLVGEHGSELIGPDRRVYPHGDTVRMASAVMPHNPGAGGSASVSHNNSRSFQASFVLQDASQARLARKAYDEMRALSML